MPLHYTLRQLEYFIAVGEKGSITQAADKVNVSPPSISAAIGQLEEEFGFQLFVRKHAHGLSLTPGGRQLYHQAKIVLEEANKLTGLANDITGQVRGSLSIGCLLSFAQITLPQLRLAFERKYPDVTVRQFEIHQAEIFARLRKAEIDIALTYDMAIPPDLRFLPLLALPPYAMVAETHPFAHRSSIAVEELKGHPMVLLDWPFSGEYFLSFLTRKGIRPIIAERTKDMAVMRSLVANNYGYAIANIRQTNDRAPDGKKLCFVPLTGAEKPISLGLALTEGAENSLTIRAFIEHCRDMVTADKVPGLNMPNSAPPD